MLKDDLNFVGWVALGVVGGPATSVGDEHVGRRQGGGKEAAGDGESDESGNERCSEATDGARKNGTRKSLHETARSIVHALF